MLSITGILVIGISTSPVFGLTPFSECSLVIPGGIDPNSFSCTFSAPDTILISETWIGTGDAYIRIDGIDTGVDYLVEKTITNNLPAGQNMKSFSHELHDPLNSGPNDANFDETCGVPGSGIPDSDNDVCPEVDSIMYTRSNDPDGLSFAQGTVSRTSNFFNSQLPDEFGTRDFIDFVNGPLPNGLSDLQTFGLRDENARGQNQAFLWRETLTPVTPPMIGGNEVPLDAMPLLLSGLDDKMINIVGVLSLIGIAAFGTLFLSIRRK